MAASTLPAHDLLLAEELLLLVLDDDKGNDKTMGVESGLAGALLLDLASGGWVRTDDDDKLAAVPDRPAPHESVLAGTLAAVTAEAKPRDAKHWVRKLPSELKPIKGRVAERLVDRGVLSAERRKLLGLIPQARYPELDPGPELTLRRRLDAELTGDAELSSRTALLVPLLLAYNLVAKIVEKDDRKEAKRRAKAISEDPGEVAAAVRSALGSDQVAIYAAVGAAVAIGGDGGGGAGGQ